MVKFLGCVVQHWGCLYFDNDVVPGWLVALNQKQINNKSEVRDNGKVLGCVVPHWGCLYFDNDAKGGHGKWNSWFGRQ